MCDKRFSAFGNVSNNIQQHNYHQALNVHFLYKVELTMDNSLTTNALSNTTATACC